jgi:hypothetical protein
MEPASQSAGTKIRKIIRRNEKRQTICRDVPLRLDELDPISGCPFSTYFGS